jgi:hypothetical protein
MEYDGIAMLIGHRSYADMAGLETPPGRARAPALEAGRLLFTIRYHV